MVTLEIITEMLFDAGMLALVFSIAKNMAAPHRSERAVSAAMGAGFLICCVLQVLTHGSCAVFILAALGFMLSYTSFLLTFSRE